MLAYEYENLQRLLLASVFYNFFSNTIPTMVSNLNEQLFTGTRKELVKIYNEHVKELPARGFNVVVLDIIKNKPNLEREISEIFSLTPLLFEDFEHYYSYLTQLCKTNSALNSLKGLKL
ncbi:hypothetical protein [Campylobacter suis]|uniref:Uncharacterized protein n=1 Tax=Campylobacter suis TaxID=2790657 RepID=A0ABM8Q5T3_9BACT|nr:hypothetical protein [Campylobacter suis]CAD7288249.1 hypothetical protein LMG8286_01217 [Campylobacter suis]